MESSGRHHLAKFTHKDVISATHCSGVDHLVIRIQDQNKALDLNSSVKLKLAYAPWLAFTLSARQPCRQSASLSRAASSTIDFSYCTDISLASENLGLQHRPFLLYNTMLRLSYPVDPTLILQTVREHPNFKLSTLAYMGLLTQLLYTSNTSFTTHSCSPLFTQHHQPNL
eukprot:257268-Pelagomonas_calceolata.AAC.1